MFILRAGLPPCLITSSNAGLPLNTAICSIDNQEHVTYHLVIIGWGCMSMIWRIIADNFEERVISQSDNVLRDLHHISSDHTKAESNNCFRFPLFSAVLYQKNATSSPGPLGCCPFFWRLSDSIDVILSDVANEFQIWSALTGYFLKRISRRI